MHSASAAWHAHGSCQTRQNPQALKALLEVSHDSPTAFCIADYPMRFAVCGYPVVQLYCVSIVYTEQSMLYQRPCESQIVMYRC